MWASSTHPATRPNSSWKKFRRKNIFTTTLFFLFGAGHIFVHLYYILCFFALLPTLMNTYIWKNNLCLLRSIDNTTIITDFFSRENKTAIFFSSFWMCTVFLYTLSCNTLKYRANLWFFRRIKISNYTFSKSRVVSVRYVISDLPII